MNLWLLKTVGGVLSSSGWKDL